MRQLKWAIATAVILAVPLTANAGFIVEGSLGTGYGVSEPTGRVPTSVMIAPGYGLGEMIRLELGLNFELGDVDFHSFDLQIRPMLVLDPPLLPFYVRGIVVFDNLIDDLDTNYGVGGALGMSFSLAGIGIFGEVAGIPYLKDSTYWVVEGRAGIYYAM
jgi:hypothetical protein